VLSLLLTALVIALSSIDTGRLAASLVSWQVAPALILVAILLPVLWRIENRAADPIIRPGLLKSRPVLTASLIGTGVGAVQSAGSFYPALAVAAIGVSQSTASWMLLPGVLGATIASPIAGRLINVIGTRLLLTGGLTLVVMSLLAFGLAHVSVVMFIAASVLGNLGLGCVLGAPLRLVVLDHSLPAERGSAQGLLSNFTSIGRLLGAAFVGSIAASAGGGVVGYQAAFMGIAVVAVGMVALALSLRSRSSEPLPATS
jgi:predicted MFS family arabinose efflux permease